MDFQTKTGKVYLQPHKAGKKWKPVWMTLFSSSSSGGGCLEIQDKGGGIPVVDHGTAGRRLHQPHLDRKLKVVPLSELISVLRLPPNAEACPMDNMSAFCVETQDRTMVFAAFKDDCVEWVEMLSQSISQRDEGSSAAHMEENQIYASVDDASDFWVVVQRTEAATHCGLQGTYWLQIGRQSLILRETQKKTTVWEWPYELLRRYGRDKLAFTIEAGRRCASGPGTFTFETQQADKIFSQIQDNIKRKTVSGSSGSHNQEGEKVPSLSNTQAHSPIPNTPDMSNMADSLERKLRTQESPLPWGNSAHSPESASANPPPITLMPLPMVPTHDSLSGGRGGHQSDAVYADPADCIQSAPTLQPTRALYVDPACVLSLKPPTPPSNPSTSPPRFNIDHPESEYSEVYDKISPVQITRTLGEIKGKTSHGKDEPIYAEPMTKKVEESHAKESKPDPFAHLYAQVRKKTPSPSPSSSPTSSCSASSVNTSMSTPQATGELSDDIIYENLGII